MLNFYLDESGNTGTNWLDENQPYFVYGGWLLEDKTIDAGIQCISSAFDFYNGNELKSAKLIDKHLREVVLFFEEFIKLGAIPVFVIADKKYMIAAKIVETFFDPMYNGGVNNIITYPSDFKKALSEYVFDIPDIINIFGALISSGEISESSAKCIKSTLSSEFSNIGLIEFGNSINNLSDKNLNAMFEEFRRVTNNGTRTWLTLTAPLLICLINNISVLSSDTEPIHIYPDELRGYSDVFTQSELFCNNILGGEYRIQTINSKANKLIQAADLLCGYISRCFRDVERFSKIDESTSFFIP